MSTRDSYTLIFCGDGECDHPAWMNEEKQAWGKLFKEWEDT